MAAKKKIPFINRRGRHAVFVLDADIEARGIGPHTLISGIRSVDYSGFVDLAVNNDRMQSWL